MSRLTEQVKAFGARVNRGKFNGKTLRGYYQYTGRNFTAMISETSCESTWWEVENHMDNPIVDDAFCSDNYFERKCDVVYALFCLDQEISDDPEKYRAMINAAIDNLDNRLQRGLPAGVPEEIAKRQFKADLCLMDDMQMQLMQIQD